MRALIFLLVTLPLFAQFDIPLMRKPGLNRSGMAAGVNVTGGVDTQSIVSIGPGTATLVRGASTDVGADDPAVRFAGWAFDGTTSLVSGVPVKAAAWTKTNCSDSTCHTVTSTGAKYINGVANASATEWDIGTAGGYSGLLTWFGQYDRAIGPGEELNNYRAHIRPRVNANIPNPWTADFAADFGRPILP